MTDTSADAPRNEDNGATVDSPELTRIDRVSVKDLALTQIRRYIGSESVAPGHRLPSERELARRLGIARNSVREALKVLEAVGLVESRVGGGTFVTKSKAGADFAALDAGLSSLGRSVVDILEARQGIEVEAARLAAERASAADLRALEMIIERMHGAGDFREYFTADMEFHRAVGQSTGNTLIADMIAILIAKLEETLYAAHGDQLPTSVESDASHSQVFEAIARRDGSDAAESMRRHLRFSTELWQALVSLRRPG